MMGDDYVIGAVMGEGLVGPRFAGRYRPSGHPVALEEVPHELLARPDFVERLAVSGRLAASLQAAHVVRVYDLVRVARRLYVVNELCRGRSLAALLGPEPMPLPSALTIAGSVLAALEEIHAAGMVHGDIRPEVVVVTAQGEVRIGGLGLAAVLAADSMLGAWPAVPPPEGGAPSIPADLFAAGALLRQLVSGLEPGAGQWVEPARLAVLVARATAQAPDERFRSAAEFRAELGRTATALLGPQWQSQSDLAERVTRPLGPQQPRPGRGRIGAVLSSPARQQLPDRPGPTVAGAALGDAGPALPLVDTGAALPAASERPAFPTVPDSPVAAASAPPSTPPGQMPPLPPGATVTPRGSPPPPMPPAEADGWRAPSPGGGRWVGSRTSTAALPWSPRRRRRRTLLLGLLGLIIIVAAAVFVVVALKPFPASSPSSGPLTVGSVVSLSSLPSDAATCDSGLTLVATGTLSGRGTLTYRWEQSENGGPVTYDQYSLAIGNDSSFRFTKQLSFAGKATITTTVTFLVLSPQSRSATRAVSYNCSH